MEHLKAIRVQRSCPGASSHPLSFHSWMVEAWQCYGICSKALGSRDRFIQGGLRPQPPNPVPVPPPHTHTPPPAMASFSLQRAASRAQLSDSPSRAVFAPGAERACWAGLTHSRTQGGSQRAGASLTAAGSGAMSSPRAGGGRFSCVGKCQLCSRTCLLLSWPGQPTDRDLLQVP